MSDPSPQPPQRVPAEPLRRIDWLAIAPWLILFRAPAAALGWPLVVGSLGSLLLGGFELDLREPQNLTPIVLVRELAFDWVSAVRLLAWIALGLVVMRLAAPALAGQRGPGIGHAVTTGLRGLPATLGAVAGLMGPLAVAVALLGVVTGWATAILGDGVSSWAMLVAFPVIAAIHLMAIGWPLTVGAVAIDRADAFDAASRTIAYATQRLGRAAFYVGVAAAVGYAASVPLELLIQATQDWWLWAARDEGVSPVATGRVARVLRGFYPAYFFTAATAVYLLLRQDVDGQPIDQVEEHLEV